jgi:hypothetical protein
VKRSTLLFPATFVKLNWAAVAGLYYFATGRKDLWRGAGPAHRHSRHRR